MYVPDRPSNVPSAELCEGIRDAILSSYDPRVRAAIIDELVHQMCATVAALHGGTPNEESGSTEEIGLEAADHLGRMMVLGGRTDRALLG